MRTQKTFWKLNRAMYGLRKAPKKWEETRNAGLKELIVEPKEKGDKQLSLVQCSGAKNIWMIKELQNGGRHLTVGNAYVCRRCARISTNKNC